MLAGLINDQDRPHRAGKVPGLGSADRRQLFSSTRATRPERDRAVDHAAHRAAADPALQRRCLVGHRIGGARSRCGWIRSARPRPATWPRCRRWRLPGGGSTAAGRSQPPGRRQGGEAASWAATVRPQTARWRRPPQPVPRDCRTIAGGATGSRAVPARARGRAGTAVYGGTGSSSPPPAPTYQRGRAPASIQPGRAMAGGAQQPGRHRAPAAPPAAGGRGRLRTVAMPRSQRGFTLIELVVTLALLGVLRPCSPRR